MKGTVSISLDYKALETLGISEALGGGQNKTVFKPSKQSPINSQTLGGLVPLDKMVNRD